MRGRMEFKLYKRLYTNDLPSKKIKKYRNRIEQRKPSLSLFLITLPLSGEGLFEVYPYTMLLQKHFKEDNRSLYVLGLADTYDDALEVVRRLVEDMYVRTGEFDVVRFVQAEQNG